MADISAGGGKKETVKKVVFFFGGGVAYIYIDILYNFIIYI